MRYHGVDLHKKYVTVSVRDEAGAQIAFMGREPDIAGHVGKLAAEDVVALEASAGALYWAERIGEQGARCVVLDAFRFRIIRDSWQKTDHHDATNLSLALWLAQSTGQVKLALVFLSEVGDITRFSSARKMYAYLGVVLDAHHSTLRRAACDCGR